MVGIDWLAFVCSCGSSRSCRGDRFGGRGWGELWDCG